MSALFLGVDGGGTKTEFLCIDEDGRELAATTTGTTYHAEIGEAEAVRRLEEGLAAICARIGQPTSAITHAFFGLPAYGEDRDVDPRMHAACGALLGHDRYTCGNDMVCGWAGSLGCDDGINIVAGTGSIGYGERAGVSARAGGWGEVFGDEGSAYWIAIQGLAAFSRMSDGRAAKGPLHERIATALSLQHDLDLCERVLGTKAMSRGEIAALAPLVSQAAAVGDATAVTILKAAAGELFAIAEALRHALGYEPGEKVSISWSGSILVKMEVVQQRFLAHLTESDGYTCIAPRHSPAYGAALYAKLRALRA